MSTPFCSDVLVETVRCIAHVGLLFETLVLQTVVMGQLKVTR